MTAYEPIDEPGLLPYVHKRSAPDNRATRRAEVKLHRRRARAIARDQGCTCHVELVLDPLNGRPVWAERSDSDRKVYIVKHASHCPMSLTINRDEWVTVIPPEPECPR